MDATGQEQIQYNETNAFTTFAVHQDLLLWEATLSLIEVQHRVFQSLESKPAKDNSKSMDKTS